MEGITIEKLYKLAIVVNIATIVLGAILAVIFYFTAFREEVFSLILGFLGGIITFSILLQNGKSLIRQTKILKEGAKPINHFWLYMLLKIVFLVALVFIVSYNEFILEKAGYSLIFLAVGYTITRVIVIASCLVLKERVVY